MDKVIRAHLGLGHKLVGVRILKASEGSQYKKPEKRMRFCQMVREAADGKSFAASLEDLACPNAVITLGYEKPIYVDIQPRIEPAETKTVEVAPLEEMRNPDVVLAILNPRQMMEIAALLNGVNAEFAGSLAVCGEGTAKPYMSKKPNVTFLCGGARTFANYKDSELIFGAPPKVFEELAKQIERFSKTCGALCGCKTSDLSPQIIKTLKDLGFEKGTDYFFGKVGGQNVRIYLNKDTGGRIAYVTIHLPMKEGAKVPESLAAKRRGNWIDVTATFRVGESIDIHSGKGLKDAVENIVEKVKP